MSEVTKAQKERAKRIIAELRKKTEENGCTEAEALANAQKIGEMLLKYDLTMDETDVREDARSCKKIEVFAADDYAGSLVTGIGRFCTLVTYVSTYEGHAAKFTMFGTPQDLEMGEYLYEICAYAMDDGWAEYMEHHGYSLSKRLSFRAGFASRVYRRLMDLKAERDRQQTSTSTALVVLKDQLVKSEWDKQGIKLRKTAGSVIRDGHAYHMGAAAGDRVNLGRPVGGTPSNPHLR